MTSADLRDPGLLVLRAGLGAMMMYHGLPKLAGGPAKWAKLGAAMQSLGVDFAPQFWGLSAALAETFGGALLIVGLLTRPAALFLLTTMIVAGWNHYRKDGFSDATHAIEDGIAFLGIALLGAGRYSLDAMWRKKP